MTRSTFLKEFRELLRKHGARLSCAMTDDADDIYVIGKDWEVSLYHETREKGLGMVREGDDDDN